MNCQWMGVDVVWWWEVVVTLGIRFESVSDETVASQSHQHQQAKRRSARCWVFRSAPRTNTSANNFRLVLEVRQRIPMTGGKLVLSYAVPSCLTFVSTSKCGYLKIGPIRKASCRVGGLSTRDRRLMPTQATRRHRGPAQSNNYIAVHYQIMSKALRTLTLLQQVLTAAKCTWWSGGWMDIVATQKAERAELC